MPAPGTTAPGAPLRPPAKPVVVLPTPPPMTPPGTPAPATPEAAVPRPPPLSPPEKPKPEPSPGAPFNAAFGVPAPLPVAGVPIKPAPMPELGLLLFGRPPRSPRTPPAEPELWLSPPSLPTPKGPGGEPTPLRLLPPPLASCPPGTVTTFLLAPPIAALELDIPEPPGVLPTKPPPVLPPPRPPTKLDPCSVPPPNPPFNALPEPCPELPLSIG